MDKTVSSAESHCVYPASDDIYRYFNGILERQYYTESGPLVQLIERTLQDQMHVKNVICISNASIAWLMFLSSRFEYSKFFLPNITSRPLNEALNWLAIDREIYPTINALEFVRFNNSVKDNVLILNSLKNLDSSSFHSSVNETSKLASMLVDTENIDLLRTNEIYRNKKIIARVVSFEPTKSDFGYGGFICTDDDGLADELRCMRGSGGVRNKVYVKRTVNGRMSEAQAAFSLMRLERSLNLRISE